MESDQIRNRKFTKRLEDAIREANHEIISESLGPLGIDDVLPVAVMVAKLRARYLHEAREMVQHKEGGYLSSEEAARLKEYREVFEEALAVFQALEHAIERGYVTLKE